mgnify:CR=1 FL=1
MNDTLVVFTYALAGFGHLRVTDALFDSAPQGTQTAILESHDEQIMRIHRFTTVNHTIRKIYEWAQDGPLSAIFTEIYKSSLKGKTKTVHQEVVSFLKQRQLMPKKIIFVSTHFGLAHQLVAIKSELETELGVKIYLVVQVTDDYAHPMWYVEGSDLIIVPSKATKEKYEEMQVRNGYKVTPMEVIPYPVHTRLSKVLTPAEMALRLKFNIVSIPVSGAAANLFYYKELLSHLLSIDGDMNFFVTSRKALYTDDFLNSFANYTNVRILSSTNDSEVVHFYDKVFEENVISLEITKPSELTFKALLDPTMRGGVALLFTQPFGPQEVSNLNFLQRHSLIPNWDEAERVWRMDELDKEIIGSACGWRALPLPPEPRHAARFIMWCREKKIFAQMALCKGSLKPDPDKDEVSPYGVNKFWEVITNLAK